MNRFTCFVCAAITTFAITAPDHASAAEPTVDEVRTAALEYAGLDRPPDRWSARARWRNLLPEVTASVGLLKQADDNVVFDEYLSHDADDVLLWDAAHNRNEARDRDRLDYDIRATIDLRGLLFDPAELAASREARARVEARQKLVDDVHDAFFRRLAVLDELHAAVPEERRALTLRVQEIEARLDGYTGGWFTAQRRGAQ